MSKKIAIISDECVACGCCEKVCPLNAVSITNGVIAIIDEQKCVGCGKCSKACPACVISIVRKISVQNTKEVRHNEEKILV